MSVTDGGNKKGNKDWYKGRYFHFNNKLNKPTSYSVLNM